MAVVIKTTALSKKGIQLIYYLDLRGR